MEGFTVGGVLRETARIIARHFGLLLAVSLLLVGLPRIVGAAVVRSAITTSAPGWAFLPGALTFVGGIFLQGAVVRIAVDSANERRPTLQDGLGAAFRAFFPLMVVGMLWAIGISLATLLLFLPGAILLCRWVVVTSVTVVERPGIFASFGRSAELTKGVLWRIFGLIVLVALIGVVVTGINKSLVAILPPAAVLTAQVSWLLIFLNALVFSISNIFGNVIFVAIYLGLRRFKEGFLSQDLVSAFD